MATTPRLVTNIERVMLAYQPGDPCPLGDGPMYGAHAGLEAVMMVNGAYAVVHKLRHGLGIFQGDDQPDPHQLEHMPPILS